MSVHDQLARLVHEEGKDAVAEALKYLPRLIALIKAGHHRKVEAFLAEAHAEVDRMTLEASRRIPDAGESSGS